MIVHPEDFILCKPPHFHEPEEDGQYPSIVYMYTHPAYYSIFANYYYINPFTGRVCNIEMVGVESNKDINIKAPLVNSEEVEDIYRRFVKELNIYQDQIIDEIQRLTIGKKNGEDNSKINSNNNQ